MRSADMPDLPKVSVLLHTYNYARYLPDAIDSVLNQTYGGEVELIVVDDGSTDHTPSVAGQYGDKIRYVRQENQGLPEVCNTSLAAATGDLIGFHSGDDVWLPDKITRQVEILAARPEVGLVYSDLAVTDANLTVIEPSFWATHAIHPVRGDVLERALAGPFVSGCTMMFRAQLRDLFFPIPAWTWEDWWITVHAAMASDFEFISDPLVLYRQHGANMILGGSPDITPGVRMHEWIAENRDMIVAQAGQHRERRPTYA